MNNREIKDFYGNFHLSAIDCFRDRAGNGKSGSLCDVQSTFRTHLAGNGWRSMLAKAPKRRHTESPPGIFPDQPPETTLKSSRGSVTEAIKAREGLATRSCRCQRHIGGARCELADQENKPRVRRRCRPARPVESRGARADEFRISEVVSQPKVDFDYRFAGRFQNRVQESPPAAVVGAGESTSDNFGAASGEPIAFFTASQIIVRENGFSRKSDIQSFSALSATAAGS
jgi:hypothetical protein